MRLLNPVRSSSLSHAVCYPLDSVNSLVNGGNKRRCSKIVCIFIKFTDDVLCLLYGIRCFWCGKIFNGFYTGNLLLVILAYRDNNQIAYLIIIAVGDIGISAVAVFKRYLTEDIVFIHQQNHPFIQIINALVTYNFITLFIAQQLFSNTISC